MLIYLNEIIAIALGVSLLVICFELLIKMAMVFAISIVPVFLGYSIWRGILYVSSRF